jgi:hypothetical protein
MDSGALWELVGDFADAMAEFHQDRSTGWIQQSLT